MFLHISPCPQLPSITAATAPFAITYHTSRLEICTYATPMRPGPGPHFSTVVSLIYKISPSTKSDIVLPIKSDTSTSPTLDDAMIILPSRKSPLWTASLLPNADGKPRRSDEPSTTSSCSSETVCAISMICANSTGSAGYMFAREDIAGNSLGLL